MRIISQHGVRDLLIASSRPKLSGNRSYGLAFTPSQTLAERVRFYTPSYTLRKKGDGGNTAIDGSQDAGPVPKNPRKAPAKTSLRQVAVEASRSRAGLGLVKGSGRTRTIDPDADTKEVTAYCAAEQYNIAKVKRLLEGEGYILDPFKTNLHDQVVHVQTPIIPDVTSPSSKERTDGHGDIFVFPSGTVVAWNVPQRLSLRLVNRVLKPAASNMHEMETEDLEYVERLDSTKSTILGETIVLGTNVTRAAEVAENGEDPETHLALAKIAFSSGLSRSTKLGVLENLFESYFQSTKTIPSVLMKGSGLPYDRPFILSKTGELLNIRAQLNLYNELTDSLPDLLWDAESSLGLEDYFDKVGKALDIKSRIDTLNDRMDYANEIATVLRERLSEKHGWTLEWYIIVLIAAEFVFEGFRFYNERQELQKEDETRDLLRRVLSTLQQRDKTDVP